MGGVIKESWKDRVIIALDVPDLKKAVDLFSKLPEVKIFKIGSQLFTSEGPKIIYLARDKGYEVFLDLKFHDIPNTVASAAVEAMKLGVKFINIHIMGGCKMMATTINTLIKKGNELNINPPKVLGVTILTSLDDSDFNDLGLRTEINKLVPHLAEIAIQKGLIDGIIASAQEAPEIRKRIGKDFIIVTPGIRPLWDSPNDQKRVTTPEVAFSNGADYIVVGRSVISAVDPAKAFDKLMSDSL